jgi:hypothetical protein
MTCPSCNTSSEGDFKFCIRCGFSLAKHGAFISRMRRSAAWILHRSLAGLSAGFIGWFIIPLASRSAGSTLPQWAHLCLSGAIGGYFLGIVEGLVEESAVKAVRGGMLGILGGVVGGLIGGVALNMSSTGNSAVIVGWGITGAVVGSASVWLEKRPKRILLGAAAGLLGGALGGWLGYQMYFSLVDMLKPETWILKRATEAMTGAVLGAIQWFVIGSVEKFWIFKRTLVTNISYKECERCEHINVLKAWYCAGCGALLQVAAPAEKMQWTKREALARLISACRFAGQLSAMSGVIVAILVMIFLLGINIFLSLFGLLAVALVASLQHTAFYAMSDFLSSWLDSPESVQRPKPTISA